MIDEIRDLQKIDSLVHNYFSVEESEGGFPQTLEWAENVLRDIRTIAEKYTNVV